MGIRIALGATGRKIRNHVVLQGMLPVVLGLGLGITTAAALSRFIAGLVFGVTPTDIPTYVAVTVVLTIVGLVACLVPVRGASKEDPMTALRAE
jgi:ABC-type antimicrobial peptide transport system permease subunit